MIKVIATVEIELDVSRDNFKTDLEYYEYKEKLKHGGDNLRRDTHGTKLSECWITEVHDVIAD
jgi:hypothetical protein